MTSAPNLASRLRFLSAATCLLLCSPLSAVIQLPNELVNHVGEEIIFTITGNEEAVIYGANHLPKGLVLDASSGIVSGILKEKGVFRVQFHELSTAHDSISSVWVDWHVLDPGVLSDFQVFSRVYEYRVGEDVSKFESILDFHYEITSVGPLPEGVDFDPELNRFSGTVQEPGIYEVDFEQKVGPTTWYTKVVLVVKPEGESKRLSLPFSNFAGMRFYQNKYYWVSMMEVLTASDYAGDWESATFEPVGFLYDLELFKDMLIVAADGGVWVSEDGETFTFIEIPNIQQVQRVVPGPDGVFLECESFGMVALYFSRDGLHWKFVEYPESSYAQSVPSGENRVVGVGTEFWVSGIQKFHVTTDGNSWSARATDGLETQLPYAGIRYGNGKFAFVTNSGVYFSSSLDDWDFVDLPPAYRWLSLYFLEDRFYAVGRDASFNRAPHILYSSSNGEEFVPVEVPENYSYIHSLSAVDGTLFLEERLLNGTSNGVIAISGSSKSTTVRVTPVIPFAADYPIFLPLEVSGEFDSIKAYGLPLGVSIDESKAIVSGIPRQELPRGKKEALFIPVTDGVPGVMSRVEYGVGFAGEEIPHFNTDYIHGVLGSPLDNIQLRLSPWIGTDDKTFEILLSGNPNWLRYDSVERKLVGTPDSPFYGYFTAHGQNLYGETSKDIQLVVSPTVFEQLPYIVNSNYSTEYFSEGGGLVFSNSRNGLLWTEDFKNWTESVPLIQTTDGVTFFKDRYYIYDAPSLYVSEDGKTWAALSVSGIEGIQARSLFVVGERMYGIVQGALWSTLNGETWEAVEGNRPEGNNVKYAGNYFFSVQQGLGFGFPIYRSADGVTWEEVADAPHAVVDLVFGNGAYVVATENLIGPNVILRSADGLNWSEVTLPLDQFEHIRAISFASGKFHMVASQGSYLTSEDGINWELFSYPESNSHPHLDFINFVGGKLLTGGSFGELYEIRAGIPPVIDMPYSQSFPLGEFLNVPIGVSGEVTEFAVEGLPKGLRVSSGRIVGIPEQVGNFRVSIVAFSGSSFSEPVNYYMNIYDGTPQASLNGHSHFVTPNFQLSRLVDFPANYHEDWSLRSPDLPAGLTIYGYEISGSLDPGSYAFTLELLSEAGEVIESKLVPVYVSEEISGYSGYQFFHLQATRGIPVTESFLFEDQALVTGISGIPPGLSFASDSKQLSGTPTEVGSSVLEVSIQGKTAPWFVLLEVSENFDLAEDSHGSYDSVQKLYRFDVNVQDANGVSYQWFYEEDELVDGGGISGTATSRLLVNDLSHFDSSGFKVKLTKGSSSIFVEIPYQIGPGDYYAWAESMGLEGINSGPKADGLGTGHPNLFGFLQGLKNRRDFQHPVLSRSGPYVSIRFKTTKDWRREQLSVLFASDLNEAALVLQPKVVQEAPDFFVWESLANAGLDLSSFFYLSVEIAE